MMTTKHRRRTKRAEPRPEYTHSLSLVVIDGAQYMGADLYHEGDMAFDFFGLAHQGEVLGFHVRLCEGKPVGVAELLAVGSEFYDFHALLGQVNGHLRRFSVVGTSETRVHLLLLSEQWNVPRPELAVQEGA